MLQKEIPQKLGAKKNIPLAVNLFSWSCICCLSKDKARVPRFLTIKCFTSMLCSKVAAGSTPVLRTSVGTLCVVLDYFCLDIQDGL